MKVEVFKKKKIEQDNISLILLAKTNRKQISIFTVDIDDSLRQFFYSTLERTIEKTEMLNIEKYDFDKNSDESLLEFISPDNEDLDFTNTVLKNLSSDHKKFPGFKQLGKMKLFAYCIKFFDTEKNDSFYAFTKIQPSKISTDESKKFIRALFSTEGSKLTEYKEITISFSQNIDFFVYNNEYLIFNKPMFEQIVDISKLIEKKSNETLEKLKANKAILGAENIEKFSKGNTILQKRLVKLHYIGIYNNLDNTQLKKIKSVGKAHNISVTIQNDQLIINDNKESVENICKLLCDYFKIGEISGNQYGTYAGDILSTN